MSTNMRKVFKIFIIFTFIIISPAIMGMNICNAAVFLDGSASGCSNGSSNYNPSTRSCGSGSDTVSLNLADFSTRLVPGATNFMRAGNYYRTNSGGVNGALDINYQKAGTASNPTIVKAYPGEERQVVIGTASNRFQYNPNPGDTSGANSVNYYPCPAVHIGGNYIIVDGIKAYGMTVFQWFDGPMIHDSAIQNSDLGGGGGNRTNPQGQVVAIYNAYNITVKNNHIHHSCWGESTANGSTLMGYTFAATIEGNTFSDAWGSDVRIKDTTSMGPYTTYIRNNFFKSSKIRPGAGGISTIGQDPESRSNSNDLAAMHVNNNIFYQVGFSNNVTIDGPTYIYNNTFIQANPAIWTFSHSKNSGYGEEYYYNNLFYTTSSYQSFRDGWLMLRSNFNHNLYYATGGYKWSTNEGQTVATSLTAWQNWSGGDQGSITANPNFVNATGTSPEDFKRTSYAENFTGSPYSAKAGAYVTGNEEIGFKPEGSTGDKTSTISPPKNLSIVNTTP